jgi:hypothetical protein
MKLRFRPRILDIAAFVLALAAVFFISQAVYGRSDGPLYVHIKGDSGEWIEPISKDAEIQVQGPLGTTYVHIEGNSARIEKSPCKNQLCVEAGKISSINQWVACLPNRVFVKIEGKAGSGGVDAGAF